MKKFLVTLAVAALAGPDVRAERAAARGRHRRAESARRAPPPARPPTRSLKKMQEDRVARAKKMDEEIAVLDNDINTKKLSLCEDKLTEMAKQLSDKKIAMQRYAQDADREVGEARDKELLDLENKIKPVIDAIGKEMGLAAIFNKFESGLVYASDAIDITDTVVKRFNDARRRAPGRRRRSKHQTSQIARGRGLPPRRGFSLSGALECAPPCRGPHRRIVDFVEGTL